MTSAEKAKRILIVEDESSLRELLINILTHLGWTCDHAKNGREAFEKVQENNYAGIISDVKMPGGDGIEFIKRLDASSPPLLFMTAHSDTTPEELRSLGAKAVIEKPFRKKDILESIEKFF